MDNKINKPYVKHFISRDYDQFEERSITVAQAVSEVEDRIRAAKIHLSTMEAMRNDMSTHLGRVTDTFNRNRHTHHFMNL